MKLAQVIFGTVLSLGVGTLAVPVVKFRNDQARREISDARDAATLVLAKQKEMEEIERLGTTWGSEIDAKSAAKAAIVFSQVRDAAREARDCLTEVGRGFEWYELLIFSLPTDCRSMYNIMGEMVGLDAMASESQIERIAPSSPLSAPMEAADEPAVFERRSLDSTTQPAQGEEDRLLLAADPATLSPDERRKRGHAIRRRILGTSGAAAH